MGKNQQYASEHSAEAMEQMQKYGIPASVILAQGILESSNGQSELSRLGNNHFGIKATSSWIEGGGQYLVYTDDKPNEKFCSYVSVADSYEHHSQFLKENSRYAELFKLSPDDYKGWADGLQKAGYATGEGYAANLIKIIEANGLDRYDKQVLAQMQTEAVGQKQSAAPTEKPQYAFPLASKEFLLVTSPFGMRPDPLDATKQQMHKGIDLRADNAPVLATETGGKVIAVNEDVKTAGGKSITVEYAGEKDTKIQVSYMHLDSIGVKVGDEVEAGQQLGISGNTGTHTTGAHLHFSVKQISANGESRDIDPASYLADIAVKGGIQQQVLHNGENLLAKYTTEEQRTTVLGQEAQIDTTLTPEEWMKKLLSSEDSGVGLGADPIMGLITTLFSSLMALALQIDNRQTSREEQMQQVTEAALDKRIDISSLVPYAKQTELSIAQDGQVRIRTMLDDGEISKDLTPAQARNLASALQSETLSPQEKQQRVANIVSQVIFQHQMSQTFDQSLNQEQSQTIQLK